MLRWMVVLTFGACASLAAAGDWQSPDSIRAAAEAFAAAELADRSGVKISAAAVDDRLRLPRCASALEAEAPRDLAGGQGVVAVSCPGPSPWRLFVPVRASFPVSALVARESLSRGQVLTHADVVVEERESRSLPAAYLTRAEDAVGQRLRRSVPAGTVLGPTLIEQPTLVRRGELVTLVAENSSVVVKAEGTSLDDAARGQRVRVRTRSGRIVEGTVTAANQIYVTRAPAAAVGSD